MQDVLLDLPPELRERLPAYLRRKTVKDSASDCLNYTGYKTPKGYGRTGFQVRGRKIRVRLHRAVWILTHGPITDATLVVDHLCGNRGCLNPDHLDLVSDLENLHRGDDRHGRTRRLTPGEDRAACVNGHPWPDYLHVRTIRGQQRSCCRECKRLASAKHNAKLRAARLAAADH